MAAADRSAVREQMKNDDGDDAGDGDDDDCRLSWTWWTTRKKAGQASGMTNLATEKRKKREKPQKSTAPAKQKATPPDADDKKPAGVVGMPQRGKLTSSTVINIDFNKGGHLTKYHKGTQGN